jgi:hypothetical protein
VWITIKQAKKEVIFLLTKLLHMYIPDSDIVL